MRRVKQLLVILLSILLLNGCVNSDITMTVNKDKSMDFEVKFLINDMFSSDYSANMISNATLLEKKGYTVTQTRETGFSGYKISKKYTNIDELSKNNGEVINIANITDDNFDLTKLFKMDKGLLKNTYTANIKFEYNGSLNTNTDNELNLNNEEVVTTNAFEENYLTTATEEDLNQEFDFADNVQPTSLASDMSLKYIVKVPFGVKNNNATNVSEDGKTLTWDLKSEGSTEIKYTFDVYNMKLIYIIGGSLILILFILISALIKGRKKKSESESLIHKDYDESIVGEIKETQIPVENIQTSSSNLEYTMPVSVSNEEEVLKEEDTVLVSNQDEMATPPMPQVVPQVPVQETQITQTEQI